MWPCVQCTYEKKDKAVVVPIALSLITNYSRLGKQTCGKQVTVIRAIHFKLKQITKLKGQLNLVQKLGCFFPKL